ncbi:MAG: Ig-like domain-containing protein, partial [Candidatus Rokubacteria bacterium]|nr:Ig-like domain-containing protein [Candidatus Rokubacteria bacterium]
NASGDAFVDLTSSVSTTDVTATVTMSFSGASSVNATVTFTAIALTLSPSPASIPADAVITSTLTATLTNGGSGISGRTINFSTTSGTLSAASAVTNASGQATVTIRATTASKTTTTPSVTADFSGVTNVQSVTLTGITISEVAELNVTAANAAATAAWAWPTATGYRDGVVILRRAGVTPAVPVDGLTVNVSDTLADGSLVIGKVTVAGGSSVADTGLTNGTKYFYRAVGYYGASLYSTAGMGVDATPTAGGAGQPLWSVSSSSTASSTLIWDGGTGLVWGSAAGFTTVDSVAGTQPWSSMMTGAAVRTPPTMTVIDVLVDWFYVIGADDGRASVVNAVTGGFLWQTAALGDAIAAAPAVQYRLDSNAAFQAAHTTDAIFVGTKNASATTNKVYALDALTGAVKWTYDPGNLDQVTAYLWADYLTNQLWVVSKSNGGSQPSVRVLSTVDGSLQTSFSLGDVSGIGWSWDASHLYVSTGSGNLEAIDTSTLALAWSGPLAVGSPIVGYVLEPFDRRGKIFFSTQSGTVRGAQFNAGGLPPTALWTTPLAGATTPAVFAAQGFLYVGGADGQVHKLQLTDGADVAQVMAGDGTQAVTSIAVDTATGQVWAATAGGKLFALPLP